MGRKSLCFLLALALALGCGGMTARASEVTEETTVAAETTEAAAVVDQGVAVEEDRFPDGTFRAFVAETCDTDGDGLLSPEEIGAVTELNVSGLGIESLRGVELFPDLTVLECQNNSLTELDLTGCAQLRELRCFRNRLTQLNVSGCPELRSLHCGENLLETLLLDNCPKLVTLQCQENRLSKLNLGNCPALDFLVCSDNCLAFLDLSANPVLTEIQAEGNESTLESMDLASIPGFDPARASDWENAAVEGTVLTASPRAAHVRFTYDLDGRGNTTQFTWLLPGCEGIAIDERNFPDENFRLVVSHSLDTTPDGLLTPAEIGAATRIEAEDFEIASLEGLAYFTELRVLSCGGNRLPYVDVSANPQLTDLSAEGNAAELTGRWDRTLDLTAISGFDPARASQWEGASVAENLLMAQADTVRFLYDTDGAGNNVAMTWHLTFPEPPVGTPIDEVHFPDEQFRACVKRALDPDGDEVLTDDEIQAVTELDVSGAGIASLAGLEWFPNLRTLNCSYNELTALDLRSSGQLENLACAHNRLTALTPGDCPELRVLDCRDNGLETLNVTRNDRLESLSCGENYLTELDLRKCPVITDVNCDYNRLSSLKLPESGSLATVSCHFNHLTQLDASAQKDLRWLFAGGNPLEQLSLPEQCTPEKLDCPAEPMFAPNEEPSAAEEAPPAIQPPEELCPNGHSFGPWIPQERPTCSETGILTHRDCTVCGKHFDKAGREISDLTIPRKPDRHIHTEKTPRVEPTCTEDGFTAGIYCRDCGSYLSGHTVIPARHTLTAWIKARTGVRGHFDCKICGKHFDADHNELADLTIPDEA